MKYYYTAHRYTWRKKYSQKAMAGVFTNTNEPSRKGIANITHLASRKAGLIYRRSQ